MLFILFLVLPALVHCLNSEVYTLSLIVEPGSAYGGSVFGTQPKIGVFNAARILVVDLIATAYVEMGESPSEYEKLWLGTCDSISCGQEVVNSIASVPFVYGVASFQNLQIKTAGSGYTLKFVGVSASNKPFAFVYSESFTVFTGSPYRLDMSPYVGSILAGIPFYIQPTIRVVDRGGNIVTSVNSNSVEVMLSNKTIGTGTLSSIRGKFRAPFVTGIATFEGLAIDKVGGPYQLQFETNKDLPSDTVVRSELFTVAYGVPSTMNFITTISSKKIRAGEFFSIPPHLEIRDGGGNLLILDNSSEARVAIYDNPKGGVIGPSSQLRTKAEQGIIRFSSLRLDGPIGAGYQLSFSLHTWDALSVKYSDKPAVVVLSEKFYLYVGHPRAVVTLTQPDYAWAGGQPFEVQPALALIDYSNNILFADSVSNVTAHVVPSLSANKNYIQIDTMNASISSVIDVRIDHENETYGAGEYFIVDVVYDFEVWVKPFKKKYIPMQTRYPYLVLNIQNSITGDATAHASLLFQDEEIQKFPIERTKFLRFGYIVQEGDVSVGVLNCSHIDFTYNNVSNYWPIVDGNDRLVNLTIPSIYSDFRKIIVVNTTTPTIVSFTTDTLDGDYGTGQIIRLLLTYNAPVVLNAYPYLILDVYHFNTTIKDMIANRTDANGTILSYMNEYIGNYSTAIFDHLENGNKTLVFLYQVQLYDKSLQLNLLHNQVYMSDKFYSNCCIFHSRSVVLRQSTYPITLSSLLIPQYLINEFNSDHAIVIDTTPPYLNDAFGVQSLSPDGTYYPGDHIFMAVSYDKEIMVSGIGIELLLNVGGTKEIDSAVFYNLNDDNKTIVFRYTVSEGTNTSQLDIAYNEGYALHVFGAESYICRKATLPLGNANFTTRSISAEYGNSLASSSQLILQGLKPYVVHVDAYLDPPAIGPVTLYRGDAVYLRVTFSAPMLTTCASVLVIQTENIKRHAIYDSGNMTNEMVFKYTVELGDSSPTGLYYRHLPNALCTESSCRSKNFPQCKFLVVSENPILEPDETLPFKGHSKKLGMLVSSNIVISPLHHDGEYNTTNITSVLLYSPSLSQVAVGYVVYITVSFSDDVIIPSNNEPTLSLNNNRWGQYWNGTGSKNIIFVYEVGIGDDISELDIQTVGGTSSAISYRHNATTNQIVNRNGDIVDITTDSYFSMNSSLEVDTTSPVVLFVYTNDTTSTFDGWFGAGQLIHIFVAFDKDVHVSSIEPRLRVAVDMNDKNSEGRYALFYRAGSTSRILAFQYIVAIGDYSPDLKLDGTDALETYNGTSKIFRLSPILSTEVNYLIPAAQLKLSKNNAVVIAIDGRQVPTVVSLTTNVLNGRYTVGDIIEITVHFTHHIVVFGDPYLNIDCGHQICRAMIKRNFTNDYSKQIIFEYIIKENDFNAVLEYVDVFSLQRGYTFDGVRGLIRLATSFPVVHADLTLPEPGTQGSLSYAYSIMIDGYKPYIESLRFTNPINSIYEVGDVINIEVEFSQPVYVFGLPYILLETGKYDRKAFYDFGTGTNLLVFRYDPQPGDMTLKLDYAYNRALFRSCAESFVVRGDDGKSNIYALSDSPQLPVYIHLNPIRGVLEGTHICTSDEGEFNYEDLRIEKQGPDYEIRYKSLPFNATTELTTIQELFVSFSNEYELRPEDAERGDLIGWSVATDGDLSVLGAPYTNKRVLEVQTVMIDLIPQTIVVPQQEIQLVRIEIPEKPEIQSFYSTADVDATISGHFRFNYGLLGPSRWIPANADPEMIEVALMTDIPKLGVITVNKEPYIYCACYNAFTWTITFHDLDVGTVNPIKINYSQLSGNGAKIIGPITIQNSAIISGDFTLKALNKETLPIPYDAGTDEMIEAIAELGLNAVEVQISPSNKARSRTWTITFGDLNGSYEIPLLSSDATGIKGGESTIWHSVAQPGRHGPINDVGISGLSGGFVLEWRNEKTSFIPYNATADDMVYTLETLSIFNYVTVQRKLSPNEIGYMWIITFDSVNKLTSRGMQQDKYGPYEPLVAYNYLIGTNTTIRIGSKNNKDIHSYGSDIRGEYGVQAGAVYVFQNEMHELDSWEEIATITANDTDTYDKFGWSVDLSNEFLFVGAIGAERRGVSEKQSIFCSATSGYFILSFRGYKTGPISHNITKEGLIGAIEGDLGTMSNLHSVHTISVEDWGGGGLCDNNTAIITFEAPVDGHYVMFGVDTHADLEMLTVQSNHLRSYNDSYNKTGIIKISEEQKGTIRPHGKDSDGIQSGSAYVFRKIPDCQNYELYCHRKAWTQQAQFFPPDLSGVGNFGYSISGTDMHVAVGAPHLQGVNGSVYLYSYHTASDIWVLQNRITPASWGQQKNGQFGVSVGMYGHTLIVGAPGTEAMKGAAYVFKMVPTRNFEAAQSLELPFPYTLSEGDRYGCSVAIDKNFVVVGSCGYNDNAIYLGSTPSIEPAKDSGAVFVFKRVRFEEDYNFFQKLTPTNVRRGDQFGWDVAINKNTIVVGSVEAMREEGLVPSVTVMKVEVNANDTIAGMFRLKWVDTNETGSWKQRMTRFINYDESALKFRKILESDLRTGKLKVARTKPDLTSGGYAWLITFRDISSVIPPLEAMNEDGLLTGLNATITVTVLNRTPTRRRGKTHIFTQVNYQNSAYFEEQAFLFPIQYQRVDRCGYAVDVANDYALVGCPNRDFRVPNHNSGSAFIYKLDFLNLKFEDYRPQVREGFELMYNTVHSERKTMIDDIMYYASTLDRNAISRRQTLIGNLFGLIDQFETYPFSSSYVDISDTAGTAIARTQFYGSTKKESIWVDGMYDYRGLSDYVEVDVPKVLRLENSNVSGQVITTPDTILENPDETFTVLMHAPGYWPSIVGRLTSLTTILDDRDGYVPVNAATDLQDNHDAYLNVNIEDVFQYDKLYTDDDNLCESGYAIGVDSNVGVMISGCPTAIVNGQSSAGQVYIYQQVFNHWVHVHTLTSPNVTADGLFGDALAIDTMYGREQTSIVVGEPGAFIAHVYDGSVYPIFEEYVEHQINLTGINVTIENHTYALPHSYAITWSYVTNLTVSDALLVQYRYAAHKTISLCDDIIVIGAPGLEVIYIFTRYFSNTTLSFIWSTPKSMRSVDFDYDIFAGNVRLHRQEFGTSVGVSGRTIAIGSPFADYEKMGSDNVEIDWKTDGEDMQGFSKGKVYVFNSMPSIQNITLFSTRQLSAGTFLLQLSHRGLTAQTMPIPYNASAEEMVLAIELLDNVDRMSCVFEEGRIKGLPNGALGYYYSWRVTFMSEFMDPPLFVAFWNASDNGNLNCSSCAEFDEPFNETTRIIVTRVQTFQTWQPTMSLSASDKRRGDRFGFTLALDGYVLAVGATYSSAVTTTTWDFESGNLQGWTTTGEAFLHQPTFGDNVYYRHIYKSANPLTRGLSADVTRSGLNGRYFIGTFEKRPGNILDYKTPDEDYTAGNTQGDELIGTMQSETFVIQGTSISFLIGGGCNVDLEYVELFVDGISVSRTTGKCNEKMERVILDVTLFRYRTGQIRVVDLGRGPWGHINVDDFRFDWNIKGGLLNDTSTATSRSIFGGHAETSRSGTVYVYERHLSQSNGIVSVHNLFDVCNVNENHCKWREVAKLTASDKRSGDRFGSSLGVNVKAGVILVGSPYAVLSGFYKETPSVYPHHQLNDVSVTSGIHFPEGEEQLFMHYPSYAAQQASGMRGVLTLRDRKGVFPDRVVYEETGAVYVFRTVRERLNHTLGVYNGSYWANTEHCKIQPPDAVGYDHFGFSVAFDGDLLAVGSPNNDGLVKNNGAVYLLRAEFAAVRFAEALFKVSESYDRGYVTITILRDVNIYSGLLILEYATSDLSAKSVDENKYRECMKLPPMRRGSAQCGDYVQTTGLVTILPGDDRGTFIVRIIDDLCAEDVMEYIQVSISVPGSASLQGEAMSAKIRIDDDDFHSSNVGFC